MVGQHVVLTPFLACVRLPAPPAQPAFDQCRGAFVEILRRRFGLASKHRDVNEAHVLGGVVAVADAVVDRETKGGHGGASGGVAQLGIPGEMAEQEHLIHRGHRSSSLAWAGQTTHAVCARR